MIKLIIIINEFMVKGPFYHLQEGETGVARHRRKLAVEGILWTQSRAVGFHLPTSETCAHVGDSGRQGRGRDPPGTN